MNDRGMAVRATCALAFSFVITVAVVSPVAAAGPWNAQVVDAETGQPLEGVVVPSEVVVPAEVVSVASFPSWVQVSVWLPAERLRLSVLPSAS